MPDNGMVEHSNGLVQREVPGSSIHSHIDLQTGMCCVRRSTPAGGDGPLALDDLMPSPQSRFRSRGPILTNRPNRVSSTKLLASSQMPRRSHAQTARTMFESRLRTARPRFPSQWTERNSPSFQDFGCTSRRCRGRTLGGSRIAAASLVPQSINRLRRQYRVSSGRQR